MTKPAAFRATYADLKLIKTRKVVQIVLELPVEQFDAAYEVLGGLPNPAAEAWFAVAALKQEEPGKGDIAHAPNTASSRPPHATMKRSFRDLPASQQAGIRCEEMTFSAFLRERWPDDWAASDSDPAGCVRLLCDVGSRSELDTNHRSRVIWNQINSGFEAWMKAAV